MKKKLICFVIIIIIVLGAVCIIDHHRMGNNEPVLFSTWGRKYAPPIESFSAVMCSAQKFHNSKDGAYLEIIFDDEKNTKKKLAVKNQELIETLSKTSVERIIGANLISRIPHNAIEGKADYYKRDIISLLIDYDDYDKYFEIIDVSLSEIYNATPEEKISEYIKDGKVCYLSTHYQMSDGTWKAEGLAYRYKYRLELTGRLHNAVKDSTYIILSNRNDITFEQAWKASGFSSNSEDYFNAEDAVIVGRK